ncbi:MAG: hypothetical protein P8077_06420 [Gammaproteobacteria bacterium]
MARLNYHANRIAHYGTQAGSQDVSGVAEDMVGLKQSEFQVKASAEVLRTEFRTIGSLLDVRA